MESGRVFADYVLAYLTGKKIKQRVVISPKYIVGDTFPAQSTASLAPDKRMKE